MEPFFCHFASALRFEYYLHNHIRFCFHLFSLTILSLEYKNSNYLWRNKGNLAYQNYAKFVSRFGQEEAFNQSVSRNHCQSFLHQHSEWRLFKPNTYPKNVIFMPQQLLNRPQQYLLMHLITVTLILITIFSTLLSYLLSKSVTGLQKISKTSKKYFGGRPTS